jgi:NO-binding membrane sensor protein with MHYT domain
MGGIAIWCMHYIGNRAIVLGEGEDILQIAYSPGFTVLSFFVPILVLLAAFTSVGSNDTVSIIRVATGGTLAGLAICGMHYLGQTGVSNYTCVYEVKNIVGAAVIAVVASTTALSVFFILRAAWSSSWWKRALTAVILAGAVSGMHWLAALGTRYRLKQVDIAPRPSFSRDNTVIVVIILVCSISRHCRQLILTSIVNRCLLYLTFPYIDRSTKEVKVCQPSPACRPRCSYL